MTYLGFVIIFLSGFVLADSGPKELAGYDAAADVITEDAVAGPFLIYDCEELHWMCVIKEDFDECSGLRSEDLGRGKKNLRCAPLSELPTKKSCFQKQLFLTSQNHGARFCISDDWKQRELR